MEQQETKSQRQQQQQNETETQNERKREKEKKRERKRKKNREEKKTKILYKCKLLQFEVWLSKLLGPGRSVALGGAGGQGELLLSGG